MARGSVFVEYLGVSLFCVLIGLACFSVYGANVAVNAKCNVPLNTFLLVSGARLINFPPCPIPPSYYLAIPVPAFSWSLGVTHILAWISHMLTLKESLTRTNMIWITRWVTPYKTALAHISSGFFFFFLIVGIVWLILGTILAFTNAPCDHNLRYSSQVIYTAEWIGLAVALVIILIFNRRAVRTGERVHKRKLHELREQRLASPGLRKRPTVKADEDKNKEKLVDEPLH